MVALKRLDDAERDGDRIYAVIRGIGHVVGRPGQEHLRAEPGRARPRRCAARTRRPATARRRSGSSRRTAPAPRPVTPPSSPALQRRLRRIRARGPAVVRARLGQVADRPHQGRGGRLRPVQGGDGAAPQGAAAHDQGRSDRTPRSRSRRRRSTCPPRPGRGSPTSGVPAAGVGQLVRLRRHQFPRDASRSTPAAGKRALAIPLVGFRAGSCLARPSAADLSDQGRASVGVAGRRLRTCCSYIARTRRRSAYDAAQPHRLAIVADSVSNLRAAAR